MATLLQVQNNRHAFGRKTIIKFSAVVNLNSCMTAYFEVILSKISTRGFLFLTNLSDCGSKIGKSGPDDQKFSTRQ
ncbi:MAG: hypothetical protein D3923_07590 [Candidatus Electrothrix sp. AR3]|nr:hypothetical protein [Candidatus Electrothrix sp. AR3]